MQNLFHLVTPVGQGIIKFPEWPYIREGLKRNLGTVISYYRRSAGAVKSDHFLVQLLQNITVPQSQNLERYYDNVDTIALNLSMALKMTSSIFSGRMFDGVFYGPGNAEVLIAHGMDFDLMEAHRQWQNVAAVRVLRHPRSDLGMDVLDGQNASEENGLVVIAINIPLLAVQYRAFRLNEMLLTENSQDSQRSIMQFIHMYVLPNMLFSHVDQALFNRVNLLRQGKTAGVSHRRHPFYLTDFTDKLDAFHENLIGILRQARYDFSGILKSIPAVSRNTMEDVMLMPSMAATRQVVWALVTARLPMVSFLFQVCSDGPNTRNQSEMNRILRNILAYRSDNSMRVVLPTNLYNEVQSELNALLQYT